MSDESPCIYNFTIIILSRVYIIGIYDLLKKKKNTLSETCMSRRFYNTIVVGDLRVIFFHLLPARFSNVVFYTKNKFGFRVTSCARDGYLPARLPRSATPNVIIALWFYALSESKINLLDHNIIYWQCVYNIIIHIYYYYTLYYAR